MGMALPVWLHDVNAGYLTRAMSAKQSINVLSLRVTDWKELEQSEVATILVEVGTGEEGQPSRQQQVLLKRWALIKTVPAATPVRHAAAAAAAVAE